METGETKALRAKILNELLDGSYEIENPDFLKLADIFSGSINDTDFADSLLDVYDKLQSLADPAEWLNNAINGADRAYVDYLYKNLEKFVDTSILWLSGELEKLGGSIYDKARDCLLYTLEALKRLRDICKRRSWDDTRNVLLDGCADTWKSKVKDEVSAGAKYVRDLIKDEWKRWCDDIFCAYEKTLDAEDTAADDLASAFFSVLREFDSAITAEKTARGALDFSDLEHLTIKLLRDPEVAALAASRYSEILVDEFQDINPAQDELFTLLRGAGVSAFTAVGDIKQSIYRFRRADPSIFLRYYSSADFEVVHLQENFRSTPEILNTVNTVFRGIMSSEFGEINYDSKAELKAGGTFPPSPAPRLLKLYTPEGEERIPYEAAYVAGLVYKLVTEEGFNYSEIAILLRSTTERSHHYVNALREYGIPASDRQRSDFFARDEVLLLLSYLQIIDNPRQDIPLIAVLNSPLYMFDVSMLAQIRESRSGVTFYEALWAALQSDDAELAEKCRAFLLDLEKLRIAASDVTCDRLITKIDECTHFTDVYFGADSRELYVRLLNTAASFESNGYKGLYLFLQRLEQMRSSGEEPPGGAENSNAVIIQTVHSSKGLEYKAVIAADLAGEFPFLTDHSKILFHPNLGLGLDIIDKRRGTKHHSRRRLAIAERAEAEEFAEAQRLLYVMLTRAKQRLYMIASITGEKGRGAVKTLETLNPLTLKSVSKPRDWLLNVLEAETAVFEKEQQIIEQEQTEAPSTEEQRGVVNYPLSIVSVPTKLSASQLKGDDSTFKGTVFAQPNFLKGKELSATDKGTALHLAMQHIDFSKTSTITDILEDIERQRVERYLSDEQAAVVDANRLYNFFASPLGAEVLGALRHWRELRFSLLVPAGVLQLEDIPEDTKETVILQGIADLCFETSSGLTIVDFKTDRITPEQLPARVEYYRGQLRAYEIALGRVLKLPVTRSVIYFFSIERAIEL
jgi:ATP-dependent helicase/nuclease subunit A